MGVYLYKNMANLVRSVAWGFIFTRTLLTWLEALHGGISLPLYHFRTQHLAVVDKEHNVDQGTSV